MNYTSLEQSKKLIELGLKPETADLYYIQYMDEDDCYYGENVWVAETAEEKLEIAHYKTPCWSLNALLEVMPQSIRKYDDAERCYKTYHLNLFRSYYHCCSYSFGPSLKEENHDNLYCYGGDTWLEAVYNTIVFLFNNGYMKAE